jgi:aspartyl-tRNA(Asn)/glutamyl-tRNA(Gln) amidotransferase subunit B
VKRQVATLERGEKVYQETRGFDASKGETFVMRSKEEARDYRFLPEPDLPPLIVSSSTIENIKANLLELPEIMSKRFVDQYGLTEYEANVLIESGVTRYFEEVAAKANPKKAAAWYVSLFLSNYWRIMNDIFGWMTDKRITDIPVSTVQLISMVNMIDQGVISSKIAKDLLSLISLESQLCAS